MSSDSVLALHSSRSGGRSLRGGHLALRIPRTLLRCGGLGGRHCRRCRSLSDCSCGDISSCSSLVGSTPDCGTRAAAGAVLGGELILARQRVLQMHVTKHEPHGKKECGGDREPSDGDTYGRACPQRLTSGGGIGLVISHGAAQSTCVGLSWLLTTVYQ